MCHTLHVQGSDSNLVAHLSGLSVKAQTRLLEDAAAAAAAAEQAEGATSSTGAPSDTPAAPAATAVDTSTPASMADAGQQQQRQPLQEAATSILEPCDVRVGLKASEAVQDVTVDVGAVQLRLSPDVLQLLQHLQQVGRRMAGT